MRRILRNAPLPIGIARNAKSRAGARCVPMAATGAGKEQKMPKLEIDEREKKGCWVHGKGSTFKSRKSVRFSTDKVTPESLNGPVIIVQEGRKKDG